MNSASQTIRGRAAAALDVAPTATPEAVHAAFLLRLASEGLAPPEECIIAVNTLASAGLPLSLDGLEEHGSLQRVAVEAFASTYWSLEPAKRRSHWQELTKEANDIQAKSRLAELEGGLDLIGKEYADLLVKEIATAVRELFVLGPRHRVVQRTCWLAERCDRFDDFRGAARRFRKDDPELAQLEPAFLRELARGAAFEPVPAIDSAIAEAERNERAEKAAARVQKLIVKKRARARRARKEPSSGGSMNSKLGCLVLPMIIFVVRLFIGLAGQTDRTTPTYPSQGLKSFRPEFTQPEIKGFIAYERQKADGNAPPYTPLGYSDWVLRGRPGTPADLNPKVPR